MSQPTSAQEIIKNYLDDLAKTNEEFAKKYANESKSIEECIKFIYSEVSRVRTDNANVLAFHSDVIFGLAVHYYEEEAVEINEAEAAKVTSTTTPEVKPESKPKRKRKAKVTEEPKTEEPAKENVIEEIPTQTDPNIPDDFDIPLF